MNRVIVQTQEQLDDLLHALKHAPLVALDTETDGLDLHGHTGQQAQLVGLSVAHEEYKAHAQVDDTHQIKYPATYAPCSYYVPIAHGRGRFAPSRKTKKAAQTCLDMQAAYDLIAAPLVTCYNVPDEFVTALRAAWPANAVMHNAQFDLTVLAYAGFSAPDTVYDTMIGAYVLFTHWRGARFKMPDTGAYAQGNMRLKWLGRLFGLVKGGAVFTGDEASLLAGVRELQDVCDVPYALDTKKHMWSLSPFDVGPYACMDAELTLALHATWLAKLAQWDNVPLYKRLSDVQKRVAWRMSMTGLRVDVDAARDMVETGAVRLEMLRDEAIAESGHDGFNPGSPKQIKEYLAALGITVPGTGKDVIADLAERVPLMGIVAAYRETTKLISTYVAKWHDAVQHTDGVLHANLNVPFVKTGRWSSSSPYTGNLQNIPRNTAKALAPKSLLKAVRPDWWLFELDYSGLELSIGAWIAETLIGKGADLTLTRLIEAGQDMHAYTRDTVGVPGLLLRGCASPGACHAWLVSEGADAAKIKDPVAEFMTAARDKSKTANFLIMYGGGAKALSEQLGIDVKTAQAILSGWHKAYPAIQKAQKHLERAAITSRAAPNGEKSIFSYLRYPLGEFALTRKYNYYNAYDHANEARNGLNSVTQGTAGGVTVLSADRVSVTYPSDDELMLHLTVHDSIELSLPPDGLPHLGTITRIMTDWPVRPTLHVDVEAVAPGGSWADKRKVNDLSLFIASEGKEGYD